MTTDYRTGTRLYIIWCNMKQRCCNPKNTAYARYGGKGIDVCPDWAADYLNFRGWAYAAGYTEELTLDRKDNNAGYSPDNCRWVSYHTQRLNQPRCRLIRAFGEAKTLYEWARDARCGIGYKTLVSRIRNGWDAECAITTTRMANQFG